MHPEHRLATVQQHTDRHTQLQVHAANSLRANIPSITHARHLHTSRAGHISWPVPDAAGPWRQAAAAAPPADLMKRSLNTQLNTGAHQACRQLLIAAVQGSRASGCPLCLQRLPNQLPVLACTLGLSSAVRPRTPSSRSLAANRIFSLPSRASSLRGRAEEGAGTCGCIQKTCA